MKFDKLKKFQSLNPLGRDLQCFMACVDAGSILKAAENLSIQQSGLSKTILKLEQDIGQTLFYRRAQGVELSEYGKSLYKSLLKTHSFWNESYSAETTSSFGLLGTVKIGMHRSIASIRYPKVLPQLLKEFPSIEFKTEFSTSLEVSRKVVDFQLDIGIVAFPPRNSELIVRPIQTEYLAAWSANGSSGTTLLYNPDMLVGAREIKRYKNLRQVQIADYEVIANILKASDFVGILPNPIAQQHKLKQVGEKFYSTELAVIWHRQRFQNSAKGAVVDSILKHLKA